MKHKIKFIEEETEELSQLYSFQTDGDCDTHKTTIHEMFSAVTECGVVALGREHKLHLRNSQEDSTRVEWYEQGSYGINIGALLGQWTLGSHREDKKRIRNFGVEASSRPATSNGER
jgi:hypothetical protein